MDAPVLLVAHLEAHLKRRRLAAAGAAAVSGETERKNLGKLSAVIPR
jgi:hypothetical protein